MSNIHPSHDMQKHGPDMAVVCVACRGTVRHEYNRLRDPCPCPGVIYPRDMQEAYDAGRKAYEETAGGYDAPPDYKLRRLLMSWRAGWFAAYWEDNAGEK